jgi:peptidylprolyl isomerase
MRRVIFVVAVAACLAGCSSEPRKPSEEPASRSVAPETSAATAAPEPVATAAPAADPGAVTTPEGLVYTDLVLGTGAQPAAGQVVSVHYVGTFTDGKKFDSSRDRGNPFSFPLGMKKVIQGWDLGIASMKVGGKRKLVIPPELAYGSRGYPGAIPPNATLVFEVELLGVEGAAPAAPPVPAVGADGKPVEVTTPEGVKYTDLVVGTGASPMKGQAIVVHYTGTLTDGSVFDSSRTGDPFAFHFGAGEVIKGWDLGLAGMKVGGKRKLVIPPELGYGAEGSPPVIPANSTLVFEVELLEVRQ